jgi:hypothetical protein
LRALSKHPRQDYLGVAIACGGVLAAPLDLDG